MAAARPILSLISLILLAGGLLLQFLVVLSGGIQAFPVNLVYFLQVSTNGITPAPRNPSRWTFWAICGVVDGRNGNCGAVVPALPFDPPRNFGTTEGVPPGFTGTNEYFYLSRCMFAFYLIALFFASCALLTGLLALFSRLGGYISGLNTILACLFQATAAALMTAWTVLGRNRFRSNGQDAQLGRYAYGFTWAAVACYFLSTILFCLSGRVGKDKYSSKSGGGFLGRKRSTRSRGSFIDGESQRRVKDDYS
ncbi:hypothetical protein W97_06775 [Coniosporium apollinis CBS 100218]|uniref:Uncharacterized protein n=1 Tax=Coniosporium apollinis (strain CBS 100218) TaxID=1168221 RepID=R7Z0G7_CONA1|nr:uncharacterized protein W97_06775 [Coniosporium apollinis CBS 100218]EON67632.1 hypothetical protein W97_06775 [Coniosporium apollinis CBS 100218]